MVTAAGIRQAQYMHDPVVQEKVNDIQQIILSFATKEDCEFRYKFPGTLPTLQRNKIITILKDHGFDVCSYNEEFNPITGKWDKVYTISWY